MAGIADEYKQDCKILAFQDNVSARLSLYLRVLYSEDCNQIINDLLEKDQLPSETRKFYKSIDQQLLVLEQRARLRNLKRHILRSSSFLETFFEAELDALVKGFVNSVSFWQEAGRSLPENFCLWAFDQIKTNDPRRDLLKLAGIISGIAVNHSTKSPWKTVQQDFGEAARVKGAMMTESFFTTVRLLGKDNVLPSMDQKEFVFQAKPTQIILSKYADNRIFPFSISL